jgi:phosphatidylserine decarboxylase
VRVDEIAFKVQLTVLDWDKLSSNDHVGDVEFIVTDLMPDAPQRDENTGLYGEEADWGHRMEDCGMSLLSSSKWEGCCAVRRYIILLLPSDESLKKYVGC